MSIEYCPSCGGHTNAITIGYAGGKPPCSCRNPKASLSPNGYNLTPYFTNTCDFDRQKQHDSLACKLNETITHVKNNTCEINRLACSIEDTKIRNSPYYNEVKVREGFILDSKVNYKIVTIPRKKKCGTPIKMELGLAYDNTQNALVDESCYEFSKRKIADKSFPAMNLGEGGFNGTAIWRKAPIVSTGEGHTVGFDNHGILRAYIQQEATVQQLRNDKIENSMGCKSILCRGGDNTPEFYGDDKDVLKPRLGMGYSTITKNRVFVLVDGTDTTGCTLDQLYQVFKDNACDVAVELSNGDDAFGQDKGGLLFTPYYAYEGEVANEPTAYAYWYITKEREYKDQFTRELAEITQQVNINLWSVITRDNDLRDLFERILELIEQNKLLEELINFIGGEVERIYDELIGHVDTLQTGLDKEIADRKSEDIRIEGLISGVNTSLKDYIDEQDAIINTRITNEVATLNETITNNYNGLDGKIDGEIADRIESITELEDKIDKEISDRKESDDNLTNIINDAQLLLGQQIVDEQMARIQGDENLDSRISEEVAELETSIATKAPIMHAVEADTYGIGNGTLRGHVRLSSEITSTSDANQGFAATPLAVNRVNEIAKQNANDVIDLSTSLATEVSNRVQADNQLSQRIDNLDSNLQTNYYTRVQADNRFAPNDGTVFSDFPDKEIIAYEGNVEDRVSWVWTNASQGLVNSSNSITTLTNRLNTLDGKVKFTQYNQLSDVGATNASNLQNIYAGMVLNSMGYFPCADMTSDTFPETDGYLEIVIGSSKDKNFIRFTSSDSTKEKIYVCHSLNPNFTPWVRLLTTQDETGAELPIDGNDVNVTYSPSQGNLNEWGMNIDSRITAVEVGKVSTEDLTKLETSVSGIKTNVGQNTQMPWGGIDGGSMVSRPLNNILDEFAIYVRRHTSEISNLTETVTVGESRTIKLAGGTDGQILSKASTTDYDYVWIDNANSPTITYVSSSADFQDVVGTVTNVRAFKVKYPDQGYGVVTMSFSITIPQQNLKKGVIEICRLPAYLTPTGGLISFSVAKSGTADDAEPLWARLEGGGFNLVNLKIDSDGEAERQYIISGTWLAT